MARRRVDVTHPQPEAVADTVRQSKTSFSGAAAFLASQAALVFAADREGLAQAYERVWLRPSAARQLAGFLDLRPPGVIGYRVAVDPNAPAQLEGRPEPLDTVRETLEALQGEVIGGDRRLSITACTSHTGTWPLHAALTYRHHFKLSGGQWSVDQPLVELRACLDNGEVLLAALISRSEDVAQVRRVATAIERKADGLLLEEIALPEDAVDRHGSLRTLLTELGDPTSIRVGNFHTRERERRSNESPADEWTQHNEAASYRMRPHSVDAMLQRIEEVDDASFANCTAFLPSDSGLTVAVTLRQTSGRDDHLGMFFHGARVPDDTHAPLTKESWESARPVDWDEREKSRRILDLWAIAAQALSRSSTQQPGTAEQADNGGQAVA